MPTPGEEVASQLPRELASAPAADVAQAVANNTDFAFDMLRQLKDGNGNLFFSPHSITVALSLAYAGTAGSTTAAFESALNQSLPQGAYHRAMNDLDRQLASRGANAKAADGRPFRLVVANQLFAQRNFSFETPYLDLLAKEYGAGVRLLGFQEDPDTSRLAINTWVEDKTEDRIKDLLPAGTITGDTRAVLVNAIYFNAAWKKPFEKSMTSAEPFHRLDGTTAKVATMRQPNLKARGATLAGTEVVELPYDGEELSALILMPPAGQLLALEDSLSTATLKPYVDALRAEELDLQLPKFELRSSKNLKAPLSALGLGVAFSNDADFSNMSRAAKLQVTDVVHQAFVKVDEAGTEAAAATAVVIGVTSLPSIRPVKIDQPFLFLIRDNATGAIVFVGRVAAP